MKKALLCAALVTPLLGGCVVSVSDGDYDSNWSTSSWKREQQENREKIAKLPLDIDYQTVMNRFDTPDFSELVRKDDHVYQVLFYATHSKKSDGKITRDECTPLVFKDDKLIGFGETAYNSIRD